MERDKFFDFEKNDTGNFKENIVLSFEKDDKFYFKKGNECFERKDYLNAIKYLWKAVKLSWKNVFLRNSYYIVLAHCYNSLNCVELSNLCYYCALESEVFAQIIFYGLGENYDKMGDNLLSIFYLNECINLMEDSSLANSAKEKLLEVKKNKMMAKLRVIRPGESYETKDDIVMIDKFMSKGDFAEAIKFLEKKGNPQNQKIRESLSLAYFFVNQTNKATKLIENFGNNSVMDLCNLLLMYYSENKIAKYQQTKEKILILNDLSDEDYFKIGLTFAHTNDYEKAKVFMQTFFTKSKSFETEFKFLYAITCLNQGDHENAKSTLIDLKTVDPFSNFIYDYYLMLCDLSEQTKENLKLDYIFNIPIKEFTLVQKVIKDLLKLQKLELFEEFLAKTDLFYFVASLPESNSRDNLLLALSQIDDERVSKYFRYVLIGNNLKSETKNKIALNRIELDNVKDICLVRNGIFTKIVSPNVKVLKLNNKNLFEAAKKCIEFLLTRIMLVNINIKQNIMKLERKIKKEEVDTNILSVFLTFDYLKDKRAHSLTKLCKYFKVSQEDFYNFVDCYNLDI